MKRFHECALVRNGNKKVGFFVCDAGNTPKSQIPTLPWQYVDIDMFKEMVKNNQVQYLVMQGDTLKCRYTDEERAGLKNYTITDDYIKNTETTYFDKDVSFEELHIKAANNFTNSSNDCLAMAIGDIVSMLGLSVITAYVYGNPSVRARFMCTIMNKDNTGVLNMLAGISQTNNLVTSFMIPVPMLDFLTESMIECNVMADTIVLSRACKETDAPEVSPLMQHSDVDTKKSVLSSLNNATTKVEKKLGLRG